MRLFNSLLLALILLTGAPLTIAQTGSQAQPAATSQSTEAKIRERKNMLLLFPLTAAAIVVVAVVVTRGKRRRRLEQAEDRGGDRDDGNA